VRSLDETKFDIRLDHNFSSADTVFTRFSYDQATSYVPGGGGPGSFAEASAFGSNQGSSTRAPSGHWRDPRVFPNDREPGYVWLQSDFRLHHFARHGTCASSTIVPGGIPGANLGCAPGGSTCTAGAYSCGLVSVLMVGGYWSLGDRGYTPFQGGTNIFSFQRFRRFDSRKA